MICANKGENIIISKKSCAFVVVIKVIIPFLSLCPEEKQWMSSLISEMYFTLHCTNFLLTIILMALLCADILINIYGAINQLIFTVIMNITWLQHRWNDVVRIAKGLKATDLTVCSCDKYLGKIIMQNIGINADW